MLTIYLTRHGETIYNRENRTQGWANSPLTERGEEAAADLGSALLRESVCFDAAYTSDSGRAVQTAQLILEKAQQGHLTVQKMPNLREWSFGQFETRDNNESYLEIARASGMEAEVLQQALAEKRISMAQYADMLKKADTADGTTEPYHQIEKRLLEAFHTIGKTHFHEEEPKNVLIVSHGLSIATLVGVLANGKFGEDVPPNTSITKIGYQAGKFEVKTFGEILF